MLKLARPALVQVCYRCRQAENAVREQPSYLPSPWSLPQNFAAWDFRLGRKVLEFWKREYESIGGSGRHRLQMDFVEISLCQFAARALPPRLRKTKTEAPRRDWRAVLPKFLKELERYRKRAVRETVHTLGKGGYADLRNCWASFSKWLGREALGRRRPDPYRYPRKWKSNIFVLDNLQKIGLQEMEKLGYEPQNLRQFREWIRRFKRQVRRGREGGLTIRALSRDGPLLRSALSGFLRRKVYEEQTYESEIHSDGPRFDEFDEMNLRKLGE